jgi:hypothetical protein
VRVVAALLADQVQDVDGTLSITKGWPEWWNLDEPPPTTTGIPFVVVAEVAPDECDQTFHLDLVFRQGDVDTPCPPIPISRGPSVEVIPGAPLYARTMTLMTITFGTVGPCEIQLSYQGEIVAVVRFMVRLRP